MSVEIEAGVPATDPPPPTGGLTRSVVSGAKWSAVGRLGAQLVQFAAGIVLARLVTPEEFGLLASIYVITGLAGLFFDLGLSSALVHLKDPSERDRSTVFWINALGGVAFAGLVTASAPVIAAFYHQPDLQPLVPLVSLPFALALTVVQNAELARSLRFRTIALVELSTTAAGFIGSIAAAAAGWGAYALVVGPILKAALTTLAFWVLSPWRPSSFICRESWQRVWPFARGLLSFNVVNFVGRNSDGALVGRYLGATQLGFYNRAYNLMLLPVQQVSQVIGRVMFPALASISDDDERLANAYVRTLRLINALALPMLVGMSASAPALVPLLWGEQWTKTVPLLQVLCLAGLSQCTVSSVGWVYQAKGRTGTMFRLCVISTAITVVAVLIGLPGGTQGVTFGVLAASLLTLPIEVLAVCRLIQLRPQRLVGELSPVVLAATGMGVAVWLVPLAVSADRGDPWLLALQLPVGLAVYLLLVRVLKPVLLTELRTLLANR